MNTKLKGAIGESGLRQRQIARQLQIDETQLSAMVCGRRKGTPEQRKALAKLLKRPVSVLFPMAALLVLFASSAFAQESPKVGMSRPAFWFAESAAAYNVLSIEGAFAHFGVYDQVIVPRVRSAAIQLALPVVVRWLVRKAPRDQANGTAITMGGWSVGYGTWHVVATVNLDRKLRGAK